MVTKPKPQAPPLDPAYASLSLDQLRALRRELSEEEARVSYWRRIIQARLDLLTRGSAEGDFVERLTCVLAEGGAVHRRLANLSIRPIEAEALPALADLWGRVVDPGDQGEVAEFTRELAAAETELSALRHEIHARLDEATGQLIARYREDPLQALSALPSIGLT